MLREREDSRKVSTHPRHPLDEVLRVLRLDCPVRGARAIRLEGGRFRLELTDPLPLPRDAGGLIDVPAATQAINDVIASWVREHPGQWLWMHRRWR